MIDDSDDDDYDGVVMVMMMVLKTAQTGNYEVSPSNHSDLLFKVSSQVLLKVRQCYN